MVGLASKNRRPNLHFDLVDPKSGINYGCPEMGWRYDRKTMARLIGEERILWPSSADGRPRRKAFFEDLTSQFTGTSSLIGIDLYTRDGTAEISDLFGFRPMDFPKPAGLVREIVEQGAGNKDIVLDFFSGSCTTAQAVMELNQKDGGDMQYIMVQLPEPCDKESEAYTRGLKTIADIGKERIRLAAKKISEEHESQARLGRQRQVWTLALRRSNSTSPISRYGMAM